MATAHAAEPEGEGEARGVVRVDNQPSDQHGNQRGTDDHRRVSKCSLWHLFKAQSPVSVQSEVSGIRSKRSVQCLFEE
eukprot:7705889-Pyramimonas_sp.AAC.1